MWKRFGNLSDDAIGFLTIVIIVGVALTVGWIAIYHHGIAAAQKDMGCGGGWGLLLVINGVVTGIYCIGFSVLLTYISLITLRNFAHDRREKSISFTADSRIISNVITIIMLVVLVLAILFGGR